jgi:hypothetical protein
MNTSRANRGAAMILIGAGAGAGLLTGGCATTYDAYGPGPYDYGAYFGSSWYDPYPWYPDDPIYVGPPIDRPPVGDRPPPDWRPPGTGGGERPVHLPARPLPPSRPATMGGGFRGGGGRGGGRH